jgi:hypothetical protein
MLPWSVGNAAHRIGKEKKLNSFVFMNLVFNFNNPDSWNFHPIHKLKWKKSI